ncbi:hypothetical protein JCM16303_003305 [Sporobolomyces ruberrimus]
MPYHFQPGPAQAMKVGTFFERYRLTGQDGVMQSRPDRRYLLAVDGWAAAVAAAKHSKLDHEDEELQRLLLEKRVPIEDLGFESIVIPSETVSSSLGPNFAKKLWEAACRVKGHNSPFPSELEMRKPHHDGSFDVTGVRIQKPLYCPWPCFIPETPWDLVPQSAVFFASRMHRLEGLAKDLGILEEAEEAAKSENEKKLKEITKRLVHVRSKIFSLLLSMALYLAAATSNRDKFEFHPEDWLETYREGTEYGSEIFGIEGGLVENYAFLQKHEERLEELFTGAAHWWAPGETLENHKAQDILIEALQVMKDELLILYENMEKILKEDLREEDHQRFVPERRDHP